MSGNKNQDSAQGCRIFKIDQAAVAEEISGLSAKLAKTRNTVSGVIPEERLVLRWEFLSAKNKQDAAKLCGVAHACKACSSHHRDRMEVIDTIVSNLKYKAAKAEEYQKTIHERAKAMEVIRSQLNDIADHRRKYEALGQKSYRFGVDALSGKCVIIPDGSIEGGRDATAGTLLEEEDLLLGEKQPETEQQLRARYPVATSTGPSRPCKVRYDPMNPSRTCDDDNCKVHAKEPRFPRILASEIDSSDKEDREYRGDRAGLYMRPESLIKKQSSGQALSFSRQGVSVDTYQDNLKKAASASRETSKQQDLPQPIPDLIDLSIEEELGSGGSYCMMPSVKGPGMLTPGTSGEGSKQRASTQPAEPKLLEVLSDRAPTPPVSQIPPEDDYIDRLFPDDLERQFAIVMHNEESGNQNNAFLPRVFQYGFQYSPMPEGEITKEMERSDYECRAVVIYNIRKGTHIRDVLSRVRGGQVVRAIVSDSMACVWFVHYRDAHAYVKYVNRHNIFGPHIRVALADSPSYPIPPQVSWDIGRNFTRCIAITDFKPSGVSKVLEAMRLWFRDPLELLEEAWLGWLGSTLYLSFRDVAYAAQAYHRLVTAATQANPLIEGNPRFAEDVCTRPLDELQAPACLPRGDYPSLLDSWRKQAASTAHNIITTQIEADSDQYVSNFSTRTFLLENSKRTKYYNRTRSKPAWDTPNKAAATTTMSTQDSKDGKLRNFHKYPMTQGAEDEGKDKEAMASSTIQKSATSGIITTPIPSPPTESPTMMTIPNTVVAAVVVPPQTTVPAPINTPINTPTTNPEPEPEHELNSPRPPTAEPRSSSPESDPDDDPYVEKWRLPQNDPAYRELIDRDDLPGVRQSEVHAVALASPFRTFTIDEMRARYSGILQHARDEEARLSGRDQDRDQDLDYDAESRYPPGGLLAEDLPPPPAAGLAYPTPASGPGWRDEFYRVLALARAAKAQRDAERRKDGGGGKEKEKKEENDDDPFADKSIFY
ncbi:hypothetical protein F5X99DRAFT_408081 [Biscogniauxia marginata]|nr:hypothetical protein F5X99DRAFT_408081 [Biscogniauxia marginata]